MSKITNKQFTEFGKKVFECLKENCQGECMSDEQEAYADIAVECGMCNFVTREEYKGEDPWPDEDWNYMYDFKY